MKSIYLKNFLSSATMVLLSFLMLGMAFVFIGRSYVINSHRESMDAVSDEVTRSASAYVSDGDLMNWDLRMVISSLSRTTGNHIFLVDTDGRVISCSDADVACPHIGRAISSDAMYQLQTSGSLDTISDLGGFYTTPRYVVAKAIQSSQTDAVLGYVFISCESSVIIGAWSTFTWVFFAAAAAVVFLALVMSLVTSKRMAQPLDEMAAAARKFAHGDFSVRVKQYEGTDEIAALTSSFNNMADSLERSEELRNEFIANVSHELKTPMTTISGFADGILDGTIPKDQEDKYLATIADETRRLSRLVRRMLSLSQMKSSGNDLTRRRDFDLNELIIRTLLNFESRAEDKGLGMDLQLPEDHMTVTADPDAITQVLYNLLDNAVKFASPGTAVGVALWKQDGKAYISVRNRGETIPEDDLPLIFDRFHKFDRSRSRDRDGVGLGLYLVKTILGAHNEDIAVTSRDGLTEFVFTLRLAAPQPPKQTKQPKPAKPAKAEEAQKPSGKLSRLKVRRASPDRKNRASADSAAGDEKNAENTGEDPGKPAG